MIIGLVGFKQVGKSTAAKYLEEQYGFARHNFKDALVAEVKANFPDLLREIREHHGLSLDELFEQKPPLVRALLQNYGTEVRRGDKDDYWTDQWVKNLWGLGDVSVVTDDVRFLNEASRLKGQAGILIRLTRPDVETGGSHKSETEQLEIPVDYTIECAAGDLETLYQELDKIVKSPQ